MRKFILFKKYINTIKNKQILTKIKSKKILKKLFNKTCQTLNTCNTNKKILFTKYKT